MAHGGTELTEFISKPHAPQRYRRHKERRRFPIQEANIFIVISFNKHCSYTPLLSARRCLRGLHFFKKISVNSVSLCEITTIF